MMRMLLAVVVVAACSGSKPPPHEPKTFQVEMHGMQFVPATVRVHSGDVVMWTNKDLVPHTVTASGWFDSGSIAPGDRYTYVVTEPVEIKYGCTFHPTMKAEVDAR